LKEKNELQSSLQPDKAHQRPPEPKRSFCRLALLKLEDLAQTARVLAACSDGVVPTRIVRSLLEFSADLTNGAYDSYGFRAALVRSIEPATNEESFEGGCEERSHM
jgi:hypothetical protein